MFIFDRIYDFYLSVFHLATNIEAMLLLFGAIIMGIIFGALPGLTATLGVGLLTTLTYGIDSEEAMVVLLGMYVGAVYGGCYGSILLNIPGTPAAAATAMEGYPLACKGEGGKALGITTTSSFIGTMVGMLFLAVFAPLIASMALQFTSFEFFLLAFFGIMVSGGVSSDDLVYKGWIAGFIGLFLSLIGRDTLQFFPRFTFGISELDGGLEIVPVLIGAFGIPQIIQVVITKASRTEAKTFQRVLPEWGVIYKNIKTIVRSALLGVGIGAVPGVGEDVAAWVSYGTAKKASKHPENFGKGAYEGIIASETANNACIGGACIPLLTLGIPGSPPAAMLLGALLIHNIAPGPMLAIDHPKFITEYTAILCLCSFALLICGLFMAKQVVKVLRIPPYVFMPIILFLCIIGSYALGLKVFNLYLMVPIGILAYVMQSMKYPIAPLVIGVILGPMADENLRRALMVSKGSFLPFFQRPVALILLFVIVWLFASQTPIYKRFMAWLARRILKSKAA